MAAPTARLLRLASALLGSSSASSRFVTHLSVRPPLFRSLAFFSVSTVESTEAKGSAVVNESPDTKGMAPPGRFANVEMKKGDWICSQCNFMNFARNVRCLQCKSEAPIKHIFDNGKFKAGDWSCPQCNFMNFARNVRCLTCKAGRPYNFIAKRGDWTCPKCNFLNFARNTRCLECSAEKSDTYDNLIVRQGDWNCPKCQFMNFARNTTCRTCQESRPWKTLRPGEWECPSCEYLNFKRNTKCLKCNCERSKSNEGASQTDDDARRRIDLATQKSMKYITLDWSEDGGDNELEAKQTTENTEHSDDEDDRESAKSQSSA